MKKVVETPYYFNGEPSWKTECILHKDKKRYIHYRPDAVIDDERGRPVLINQFALNNNGRQLVYSRKIEYADKELE